MVGWSLYNHASHHGRHSCHVQSNSYIDFRDRRKCPTHVLCPTWLSGLIHWTRNAGIASLCRRLAPDSDMSTLCINVVATWEGLQTCKRLTALGINTLATTLFTMGQAILAGEAGCIYIAPFVHELKSFFDAT